MQTLTSEINNIEKTWLPPLSNHISTLFANTHLPSHDVDHHLRVWRYCIELILELDRMGVSVEKHTIEGALIASLFHDTGLILDKSERHGYQSRMYCEKFFSANNDYSVSNFTDILFAIEHHDDKRKKTFRNRNNQDQSTILSIVSTADDLDAFGFIGIYRYIEIYLHRGYNPDTMAKAILPNLQDRYSNFVRRYYFLSSFLAKQKVRYTTTKEFFSNLIYQVIAQNNSSSEEMELVSIINKCNIQSKLDIDSTIAHALKNTSSKVCLDFFGNLKNELCFR